MKTKNKARKPRVSSDEEGEIMEKDEMKNDERKSEEPKPSEKSKVLCVFVLGSKPYVVCRICELLHHYSVRHDVIMCRY